MNVIFADAIPAHEHEAMLNSRKVGRWLDGLRDGNASGRWNVTEAVFHLNFMFDHKVGYVMAEARGTVADGKRMHGLVMLRGDAVTIIPVLVTDDLEEWTVMVEQLRPAVGQTAFVETVAGMVDEGEVSSKAMDELAEETGEDFGVANLVEIGRMYPSVGGADEQIVFYAFAKRITYDLLESLHNRTGGLESEGESINVRAIPLACLPLEAPHDFKARMGHALLEEWRRERGFECLYGDVPNLATNP